MYILEVIPLISIPRSQNQVLSYFHTEKLEIGSLVEVKINKRTIKALIVGSQNLKDLKIKLKKEADFELKPILKVIQGPSLVNKKQLNLALWLSAKYYAPLGLCVKAVLPPFWAKKTTLLRSDLESLKRPCPPAGRSDLSISQKLVLIPEKIMAIYFLEKYAGENPVFLSSSTPNKEYFNIWQKVLNGEIKTIVGTRVALFLPFKNLKEIIVEDESNAAYRSDYTPKYAAGDLARRVAKEYGVKITINDLFPRVETYYELDGKVLPKKVKIDVSFANMVSEIRNGNFSTFSRELQEQLKLAIQEKKKVIIFVPRKGYAPYLLCQNCGHVPRCPKCGRVLSVHKLQTINYKLSTI